jgi:hypothetical protein
MKTKVANPSETLLPVNKNYGGRAVAQAVSRWLPTAGARVRVRAGMWGLWCTKRHWSRFSPSASVFPANHSTNFSIITITWGWYNRPIGGRSAEWAQFGLHPQIPNKKIIKTTRSHFPGEA